MRLHEETGTRTGYLLALNLERGMEYALAQLPEMKPENVCSLIGDVVQYGELVLRPDRTLDFEAHPGAEYATTNTHPVGYGERMFWPRNSSLKGSSRTLDGPILPARMAFGEPLV